MRRILTSAICVVMLSAFAPAARADVVADFWDNVLSNGVVEVTPGVTKIRVVFVTSPVIDALDPNNSYYDNFGDGRANSGLVTSTFGLANSDWKPLVTAASDTGSPVATWINAHNIPVFNTKGELVASSASSMLGSSVTLLNAIRYDESADDQAPPKNGNPGSVGVWTGTNSLGNPATVGSFSTALGSVSAYSTLGDGASQNANWINVGATAQSVAYLGTGTSPILRSIYVMSGEITAVPEPTTLAMWLGLGGIAGLVCWRKRRKSS